VRTPAPARPFSPSVPLATLWGYPVGADPLAHALILSLPCGPHPSDPVPNLSAMPPPWMRPRLCIFRPPSHALAPLELAPRSPTFPCSIAPSAEHSRPARAPRQLRHHSPTSTARSTVTVELPAAPVAPVSSALSPATWNAPWFALSPSGSSGLRSLEHFLCSQRTVVVDPRPRLARAFVREPLSLHLRKPSYPRPYFPLSCAFLPAIARRSALVHRGSPSPPSGRLSPVHTTLTLP
jgi:hypothetical protein